MRHAASLHAVTKTWNAGSGPVTALDAVDLEIPEGCLLAIMGASGSGKSTMLNVLAGLVAPDAGRVTVAGQDLAVLGDRALTIFRRRRLGIVFQAYNLVPVLSARENVALPLILDGMGRHAALAKAETALGEIGLGERAGHHPDQLSGGEQQRVALARALIADPALILADEPTGNLDSASTTRICALLRDLHASGRTVLIITHEAQVASHAERVVVLADGRIRGELHGEDLASPARLAQAYLELTTAVQP